jgi:hypothetical protein
LEALREEALVALEAEGVARDRVSEPRRIVELRYLGQDATLEIEPTPEDDLERLFEDAYFRLSPTAPATGSSRWCR